MVEIVITTQYIYLRFNTLKNIFQKDTTNRSEPRAARLVTGTVTFLRIRTKKDRGI